METTRIDIDAYYKEVNDLISKPQEDLLENCKSVMTLIVMRCMFEKALKKANENKTIAEIKLFCGKLSVFRKDFQKHIDSDNDYSQEDKNRVIASFKAAVMAFLEHGHRFIAIIEFPTEWKAEEKGKGYFAQLFAKYPEQIELKTPKNNFNQLLGVKHFAIAPTIDKEKGAARWEVDESEYKALVSSSQTIYGSYSKLFATLNQYSVPI